MDGVVIFLVVWALGCSCEAVWVCGCVGVGVGVGVRVSVYVELEDVCGISTYQKISVKVSFTERANLSHAARMC